VLYSLQRIALNGTTTWVWFDNYVDLFTDEDFRHSIVITAIYAVMFVVVSTVVGLSIALLLNEEFRGRSIARALLIVPWACPWVICGIIWKWFVDGQIGGLNAALEGVGAIDGYRAWLADDRSALVIAVFAAAWRQASFNALLFLAALQTIPSEVPEAAEVDGASTLQRFRYVTLPWLRPVMVIVIVLNVIFGFMQFDVIYALTQGGPGSATEVLSIFLYEQLFVYTNTGRGSGVCGSVVSVSMPEGAHAVSTHHRPRARRSCHR
jgi:ABC-type sugar transport system permease subunit